MCGLVGVAGRLTIDEKKMFWRLLELDTSRGPHSTGILSVNDKGRTAIMKRVGTPWDLYQYKAVDKFQGLQTNVMMGHNRWATKGRINEANAHPFELGHIVGAHNGTLRGQWLLDDYIDYDVDSENIFHHIAKNGIARTIPVLDGAFALEWWDSDQKTLNFIRNDERTLSWAYTKDKKTLVWASEEWMMVVAARINKVELGDIRIFKPLTHYKFDVPRGLAHTSVQFPKVVVSTYKEYERPKPPAWVPKSNSGLGGNQAKKDQGKVVKCSDYLNQLVDIEIVGPRKDSGQRYILARLLDEPTVSMRLYPYFESPQWKKLLKSSNFFEAKAKSYRAVRGVHVAHLVADLRTVVEIEYVEDDEDKVDDPGSRDNYEGFNGAVLTYAQWLTRTKNRCAWCGNDASPQDEKDLSWFAYDEFMCNDCKNEKDVKEYLKEA